jgi:para-nitrobenzyl esterase
MTLVSLHRTLIAMLLLATATAGCRGGFEPEPEVDSSSLRSLPAGDVVGFTGRYGSHAWRGIPYAEPPVRELRWRAPRPAARWEGAREALATGTACSQFASVFAGEGRDATGVIGSEDCLYLDVWAPSFAPDQVPSGEARLPVMFWIHGGGNSIGRAGFYDGGNLAATHDLVLVAINYRLGPFGWFRHESLRGEGTTPADRSGNFGTLDMVLALEWVQQNISAFGGDPNNVTIFGESAGGTNVLSMMLASRARGLFHRAIIQSGGMGSSSPAEGEDWSDDPEPGHPHSASEILAALLVRDGSAPDRGAAVAHLQSMDTDELEAYLRAKSHQEILAAYVGDEFSMEGMLGFPAVFRDGEVLPTRPAIEQLASGAYNQVPVILGTNRDENKLFMAFDPNLVHWRFGLFPRALDADSYQAQSEHQANAWKARSVDRPAALMRAVQGPSVYAYRWDWDDEPSVPFLYDGGEMIGAGHGLEIAFAFGHWDLGPDSNLLFGDGSREGREVLSAQMMSYWAEFAYSGSPGRGREGELPEWRAWDDSSPDAPKYAVLDTPEDGGVRLASRTYTMRDVVADLLEDSRLDGARQKCGVLRNLTDWDYLSREDYAAAGGALCGSYAFEEYPWADVAVRE